MFSKKIQTPSTVEPFAASFSSSPFGERNREIKNLKFIPLTAILLASLTFTQAKASLRAESLDEATSITKIQRSQALPDLYNLIGVALFSGKDPVSGAIKKLTHSNVSHVGLILSDINSEDENSWYCFESTGSASEVFHAQYPHVRISPWSKVVEDYKGDISYRLAVFAQERVNPNSVTGFVEEHNGKSYTKNPIKLLKALFRKHIQSEPHSTFFCSELAARMLMDLGLIAEGVDSNALPKDFAIMNGKLHLTSGFGLTPAFLKKENRNVYE